MEAKQAYGACIWLGRGLDDYSRAVITVGTDFWQQLIVLMNVEERERKKERFRLKYLFESGTSVNEKEDSIRRKQPTP